MTFPLFPSLSLPLSLSFPHSLSLPLSICFIFDFSNVLRRIYLSLIGKHLIKEISTELPISPPKGKVKTETYLSNRIK